MFQRKKAESWLMLHTLMRTSLKLAEKKLSVFAYGTGSELQDSKLASGGGIYVDETELIYHHNNIHLISL